MAKRRVHIALIITNEASADGIITSINARLGTLDVFNLDFSPKKHFEEEATFNGISAQARFNNIADANNFKSFTQGLFANSNILTGSRIALHTCLHDEPESNWVKCVEDEILVK